MVGVCWRDLRRKYFFESLLIHKYFSPFFICRYGINVDLVYYFLVFFCNKAFIGLYLFWELMLLRLSFNLSFVFIYLLRF